VLQELTQRQHPTQSALSNTAIYQPSDDEGGCRRKAKNRKEDSNPSDGTLSRLRPDQTQRCAQYERRACKQTRRLPTTPAVDTFWASTQLSVKVHAH